jgi:hypothetical protein
MTTPFTIRALPADVVARVRATGTDAGGQPAVRLEADGGEPLRCCLRDARPGEACLLFNYVPPLPPDSPYREAGAVYVHADGCPETPAPQTYPTDWYGRPQVLRAYDARGWIHPATTTHDGSHPEAAIAAVLAEPDVVEVHSHNIAYGCYMFAITR